MSSRLAPALPPVAPSRSAGVGIPANPEPRALRKPKWRTQPQSICVPREVEARAAAAPNAPALIAGTETMSYGELNQHANQLGQYLSSLGVGSSADDSIVGLCLDRSAMAVVCALGILKSGGAYLPLDPAYPIERIAFMLNDAQPRVLVTTNEMASRLPAGPWQVIAVDRDETLIRGCSIETPTNRLTAEQLAYVIYTSGSTGKPKGVEISHASLMNLVNWHQTEFEITADDRATLLAGVGFDAAVWETWPYLTAGASLHLADDTTRLSPEMLRDWLLSNRITNTFLPTALAERIMALAWPAETQLRTLLTGAETLRQFPTDDLPFSVVNNYGPTECTVVATSGTVPNDVYTNSLPSIGRPIANTQIYILDENMQQVPVHAAGEIYIGGAGLARGYLNRPELTAEKFVHNPFSNDPAARLYRTGDIARLMANGDIAYLGRIDEQIKILGHRIEPNEIVHVLDRHPAVASSRVIARQDACSEKHLVAYVVFAHESEAAAADLRSFLANELPQHMVPPVFVRLDSFTLTQNGKVDRAALPSPSPENTLRDHAIVPARTPLEERLEVMLSSLLGLDGVSVDDNFFMLGGHSLLGTQLISQVRGTFGVELPLRTLFESPTIEQLATEIERLVMAQVEALSDDEVQRLLA